MKYAETADALIARLQARGKRGPLAPPWNELRKMLPNRRRNGNAWEPSLPLIVAVWQETPDEQKFDRLAFHLKSAEEHGSLGPVAEFLGSLQKSDGSLAE